MIFMTDAASQAWDGISRHISSPIVLKTQWISLWYFMFCVTMIVYQLFCRSSGGRVVKILACGAKGPGFDSRPRHLNFQRLVISCFQVAIWLIMKYRLSDVNPQYNQPTNQFFLFYIKTVSVWSNTEKAVGVPLNILEFTLHKLCPYCVHTRCFHAVSICYWTCLLRPVLNLILLYEEDYLNVCPFDNKTFAVSGKVGIP